MQEPGNDTQPPSEDNDRREFLKKCGRFAAITPPAVTMLLSTSLNSKAIAGTSGRTGSLSRPGNGWGDQNHQHSGPPGKGWGLLGKAPGKK
jgi:hypothetical protein